MRNRIRTIHWVVPIGLEVIQTIRDERLIDRANETGAYFKEQLLQLQMLRFMPPLTIQFSDVDLLISAI